MDSQAAYMQGLAQFRGCYEVNFPVLLDSEVMQEAPWCMDDMEYENGHLSRCPVLYSDKNQGISPHVTND